MYTLGFQQHKGLVEAMYMGEISLEECIGWTFKI